MSKSRLLTMVLTNKGGALVSARGLGPTTDPGESVPEYLRLVVKGLEKLAGEKELSFREAVVLIEGGFADIAGEELPVDCLATVKKLHVRVTEETSGS